MKPKICLIRCPCITLPYPPDLGLAYVSASLKAQGYSTRVLDLNWELFLLSKAVDRETWLWRGEAQLKGLGEKMLAEHLLRVLAMIDDLASKGFGVFGFSVWESNKATSLALARLIRQRHPEAIVIFGGPECMPQWSGDRLAQEDFLDAVVYGEGEQSLLELMGHLEHKGRLEPTAGCYVRTPQGVIQRGEREPIAPASLPFPDFDDYDLPRLDGRIAIAFNRGCVWKCKFCSVPGYIPKFRWRSAEHIFDEMKRQVDRYQVRRFMEFSPTLNSNMKELLRLANLLIERKLEIEWEGYAIFHPGLTSSVIRRLRESGCRALNFGMESGSQKVLDSMGKKFQVVDAARILRDLKSENIRTCLNFVIGFPNENEADFQETLDFVARNAEFITNVGSMSPMWLNHYIPAFHERDRWNIVLEDPADGMAWHTQDLSNTPSIRESRRNRFVELSSSLGLYLSAEKNSKPGHLFQDQGA